MKIDHDRDREWRLDRLYIRLYDLKRSLEIPPHTVLIENAISNEDTPP